MPSISKISLYLTLLYFSVWCAGPLFFSTAGDWFGLPIWFVISCLLAPAGLICYLLFSFLGRDND